MPSLDDMGAVYYGSNPIRVMYRNGVEVWPKSPVVLTATATAWDIVTLTITPPMTGADSYVIKRDGVQIHAGPELTFSDTLRMPSTIYNYTVDAMRGSTVHSTATASATTAAYQDLGLTAGAVAYNRIDLSWLAANGSVDSFELWCVSPYVVRIGAYGTAAGSAQHTGIGASAGYTYELSAFRGGVIIKKDTASASTPAVPVVYTWAYGSTTPDDNQDGWVQSTQRVLGGNNVQFVGGTNYLAHVTFRASGNTTNGRFEPYINGASIGNEHIKGAAHGWNDFVGNSNCAWGAGVVSTQLRCGGVGGTTHNGCLGGGGGSGISDWGTAWWAAWAGQRWDYYVCTYGVYYWYYAYRSDFEVMATRFEWMTTELAATLADRNLQMFTWCEPDEFGTITKVQIADYDTEELLVDWEAAGYTRKNLDQLTWTEWLAKRNAEVA